MWNTDKKWIWFDKRPLTTPLHVPSLSHTQHNTQKQGYWVTVVAFPHPAIALWSAAHGLHGACIITPDQWHEQNDGCERILPHLWTQFCLTMEKTEPDMVQHIGHVATFKEPGPYTRLRMGRAFASGLAMGLNAHYCEWSVFDVVPWGTPGPVAVHIGLNRWVVDNDNTEAHTVDHHTRISSETCTPDHSIHSMEHLFIHAINHGVVP